MERAWHQADACEVTSREGQPGVAPMKMFFSGFRGSLKAKAAETIALATLEDADKVVAERRTIFYNRVVTSYHKAKIERAGLARELEVVKAEAARVPQLEEDLRIARAQCAESEEAGRAAAAKLKVADGELARLRRLEDNHLKELAALKKDGEEKLEGLSKRLEEVERQPACASPRAAFPEAQDAALAAVGKAREERRQALGSSSACFTMEDYLASMAARVEPITKLGWELRKAAEELIRLLWPTETLPQDLANLIKWLETRPTALDRKEPAARAGPIWPSPSCSPGLSAENKTARLARACAIADFVDKRIFIEDPNPPSDDEEEELEEDADMPEADPAAGNADTPPAGPDPAGA
ncbi:hypothetical protein QYE76_000792 [Lolium multiflorum]|uniref:Uncharacterized protein n=1 Tax=Lolium multiflorum TaxID=4521 RepID=A0AAD8VWQ9_LOLMU|nr:hypothetical protein QYE76_000792 [Lolium multiflorum]